MREYTYSVLVPRNAKREICFYHIMPDPDSGVPGYPETRITRYMGVEKPFQCKTFIVDEECAEHFRLYSLTAGSLVFGTNDNGISATVFKREGGPKLVFKDIMDIDFKFSAVLENVSNEDRIFKCIFIGHDLDSSQTMTNQLA